MAYLQGFVALMIFVARTSAQFVAPAYYYPLEQRSLAGFRSIQPDGQRVAVLPIEQLPPSSQYSYQIVPSDEYSVYVAPSTELSIWDYIPSPLTALTFIGTTAVAIGKWVLVKTLHVLFGVALVVGFCAFTPYCTLTISKPFVEKCSQALKTVPYLDEIEDFFSDAVYKLQELNEVRKK